MPNKTIYLNTIKNFETTVGFSFIDKDSLEKKLQDAWKNDQTPAKTDYLAEYRKIFHDTLRPWVDSELSKVFYARSEKMPDLKKCLLKMDETLKTCAMALIPGLRKNEDVLSNMTFGVADVTQLKNEFVATRAKYLTQEEATNAAKKRKENAYNKYKSEWMQTTTRKLSEVVRDEEALKLMSPDEKIDFALALQAYRNDTSARFPLSEGEKDLLDEALLAWESKLGCENGEKLEDFVVRPYTQYAPKIGGDEWLDKAVKGAVEEYDKTADHTKKEIADYRRLAKNNATTPNKTIYLNTIKSFEKMVGFSFIDKGGLEKRLQEAWKNDQTPEKTGYLAEYQKIFHDTLRPWTDRELSKTFYARGTKMPDFKKCLLKTDAALKKCAMALIPDLRENVDVLSKMTFGTKEVASLKNELTSTREKYLDRKEALKAAQRRKEEAYNKYKGEWTQTTTRKICEIVRDKEALKLMPQDEKIDFALALQAYRNDENSRIPLSDMEKDLLDETLLAWESELGCNKGEKLEERAARQYSEYAPKIGESGWLDNAVNAAIEEYDKTTDPAKKEIADYNELTKKTTEGQEKKETSGPKMNNTNNVAEMVGDFFMQHELTQGLTEESPYKERRFLEEKVEAFNQKYGLRVSKEKLRTSIEQISILMIKAREEKEHFLSKDGVVVIENGKETYHAAKDYFKDIIEEANKKYLEELTRIDQERQKADEEYRKLVTPSNDDTQLLNDPDAWEKQKKEHEKAFKEKTEGFNKSLAKAKNDLKESLSITQGGVVIEKDGNSEKKHKASRYYETHETQKEQYAYGEYQKMFSRVYKDACKNLKQENYSKGRVTDFSLVAKDVDQMFKTAIYACDIYDNPKNVELVQKCSFGGFSAETLASSVMKLDGDDWGLDQTSEKVWPKQVEQAKKILFKWEKDTKNNKKMKPGDMVAAELDKRRRAFEKGEITKKEMLDYAVAAEAHYQRHYSTKTDKRFNPLQHRHEKRAIMDCRASLGLTPNDSLRAAMNNEYTRLANYMSKEEAFKQIRYRMDNTANFKDEKSAFEKDYKATKDKIVAEKKETLEKLRTTGREPLSIPTLDEKKTILYQKPRVQPIQAPTHAQPNLNKK